MKTTSLVFALLLILFTSCARRSLPTVEVTDTTNITVIRKDTAIRQNPDSSLSRYLIECQETAEGYKAVITQLIEQQNGEQVQAPLSKIENGILTNTVFLPGKTIYLPVYRYYSTSVKSKVYVKITNELTWFQQGKIYGFWILAGIFAAMLGLKIIRMKTGGKLFL